MAIISNLDRRTSRGKTMMFCIYALLFLGAVSMVYPFLLMLRMTTMDSIDRASISVLPDFLWNNDLFARKTLSAQYRLVPGWQVASQYGTRDWTGFDKARDFWKTSFAPLEKTAPEALQRRVSDYLDFAAQADLRFLGPALRYDPEAGFENRFIVEWLARHEGVSPKTYRYFETVRPDFSRRDWTPPAGADWRKWRDWLAQLAPEDRFVFSSLAAWQRQLDALAKSGVDTAKWRGAFPVSAPVDSDAKAVWERFIAERYPLFWQELDPTEAKSLTPAWQQWLAREVAVPNAATWKSMSGADPSEGYETLPVRMPNNETTARWWCSFVKAQVPVSQRTILSSENAFAEFLAKRYGTPEKWAAAWGITAKGWEDVRFPLPEVDFLHLIRHETGIKWDLCTANFRVVIKSLLLEGGAFSNTFIIVLLSIATSLTINPLAAYALSRFRMRGTNKILIFLLATMALPGEVAMVPGFLLVRDLHLTDTFWALVLPSAANAFSIFLLKGFFDSLPQELYEAALIDGAGEFTLFTRITIPLSMPIIAVTLLATVTHAYNLFMPAVMYLGDVSKWPLATKIYEINQVSAVGVGMAALVVSSIFPLLVFIFCQRIIMRGIILPSMK
jgi:ABC-type glycerol-3-phosphate transport system permease component